MKTITEILGGAQTLLPVEYPLQECFPEYLNNNQKLFLAIIQRIESSITIQEGHSNKGRPAYPNICFFRAFLAQSFFKLDTMEDLRSRLHVDGNLRILCGFQKVPSLPTFSRRHSLLAEKGTSQTAHEHMIKENLASSMIGHISRDSTAIAVRSKVVKAKKEISRSTEKKYKRGRPRKDEVRPEKPLQRIAKQAQQSPEKSLSEISKKCQWGCKINSQGNKYYWKGYKLHLDVTDFGLPVTALFTGANVHDSQLAIPMEQLTEQRCTFLYSVMDSAYDAKIIHKFIRERNRIPIIDPHTRKNGIVCPLDPAKKQRFKVRSSVERANAHLKDWHIPDRICFRSDRKIEFVVMNAVLVLSAIKLIQYPVHLKIPDVA
jgi:transposase